MSEKEESLTDFIHAVTGDSHLRVEDDLGDGFVRLRSAEAERRQAKHDIRSTEDIVIEMLRNARDAGARSMFVALTREGHARRIVMLDDGMGIPQGLQERIFEPRVTSKLDSMHLDRWGVHGRGMALYSIKANATEARVVASGKGMGSALLVETDLRETPEKTDQSSWPIVDEADAGEGIRGPRNINRTVVEFALEDEGAYSVYLGSVTDIIATLRAFGASGLSAAARLSASTADLPVCKRLSVPATPEDLAREAGMLGLGLSERSARRILDGEITPLEDVAHLPQIRQTGSGRSRHLSSSQTDIGGKAFKDARGLRIAPEDLEDFKRDVKRAYRGLARDYFLEPDVDAQVNVRKDGIHVTIPVRKQL